MIELIHNAYQSLTQTLSPRFKIELLPYTETLNVVDEECRSQFDRSLKDYYISEIDGRFLLIFRSKFDRLKGLSDEQVDLLRSNDVTIEFFKDQIYLKDFEVESEKLAEKIVFLADFLKEVYSQKGTHLWN